MNKFILIAVIFAALNFEGPKRLTFTSCSTRSGEVVATEGQLMIASIRKFAYASNIEFYQEGFYYCYKITYWL